MISCGGEPAAPTPFPSPTPTTQPTATLSGDNTNNVVNPTPTVNNQNGSNGTDASLVSLGAELFVTVPDNAAPQALWCYQCHMVSGVDGATGLIGPDLSNIGTDASSRQDGVSAEQYIKESIIDPEAFVPQGIERSSPGLMTSAIVDKLTSDQVDALVAFLIAQK